MTTVFFNQKTQPAFENWIATGAPLSFVQPERPVFSTRVRYNNGRFVAETWQVSRVSVCGINTVQEHLRCVGLVNVTKKGELGATIAKMPDSVRWTIRQAYSAWIASGKRADFVYIV